jgi:putative transposase
MTELKNRGGEDVLIAIVDGLKGFPDAITAVFPQAQVQTCIVHLIRNSLDLFVGLTRPHRGHGPFSPYKDRKAVVAALKEIYRATDADAARQALNAFADGIWGTKYPAIAMSWRRHWPAVIPFFAFPVDVRRIIYTTNAIEALNAKLRRAIRTRGHFPTDDSALKLLFLVLNLAEKE